MGQALSCHYPRPENGNARKREPPLPALSEPFWPWFSRPLGGSNGMRVVRVRGLEGQINQDAD